MANRRAHLKNAKPAKFVVKAAVKIFKTYILIF